ncbi:hypothetical protein GCM10027026_05790 [Myroides odoratimimus subsp. xuanwuensis]
MEISADHGVEVLGRPRLRDPAPLSARHHPDQEQRSALAVRGKVHRLCDDQDTDVLLKVPEDDAFSFGDGTVSRSRRAQVKGEESDGVVTLRFFRPCRVHRSRPGDHPVA